MTHRPLVFHSLEALAEHHGMSPEQVAAEDAARAATGVDIEDLERQWAEREVQRMARQARATVAGAGPVSATELEQPGDQNRAAS